MGAFSRCKMVPFKDRVSTFHQWYLSKNCICCQSTGLLKNSFSSSSWLFWSCKCFGCLLRWCSCSVVIHHWRVYYPPRLYGCWQIMGARVPHYTNEVLARVISTKIYLRAAWRLLYVSKSSKSWWFNLGKLLGSSFNWIEFPMDRRFIWLFMSVDAFPVLRSLAFLPASRWLHFMPYVIFLGRCKIVLTALVTLASVTSPAQQFEWKWLSTSTKV